MNSFTEYGKELIRQQMFGPKAVGMYIQITLKNKKVVQSEWLNWTMVKDSSHVSARAEVDENLWKIMLKPNAKVELLDETNQAIATIEMPKYPDRLSPPYGIVCQLL